MAVANLFERLSRERPAETKTKRPHEDPAQRLLNRLQQWPKPTIYTRDILRFGPRTVRNRNSATDATDILVKHGWPIPNKTNQRNRREWQIVRKPVIHPVLAD